MTDAELRRLAEGATPGPWEHQQNFPDHEGPDTWWVDGPENSVVGVDCTGRPCVTKADSRYIAAVSPDAVLDMLNRLDLAHRLSHAVSEWEDLAGAPPEVRDARRAYDKAS